MIKYIRKQLVKARKYYWYVKGSMPTYQNADRKFVLVRCECGSVTRYSTRRYYGWVSPVCAMCSAESTTTTGPCSSPVYQQPPVIVSR